MPRRSFAFTVAPAVIVGGLLTSTSPTFAAPPGFPDLNTFTPVDPAPYTVRGGRGTSYVIFSTPEGVSCSWYAGDEPNQHTTGYCEGNIPGIPGAVNGGATEGCPIVRVPSSSTTAPYTLAEHGGTCPPFATNPTALSIGQKITKTNITCAVGAGSLIACIDPIQDHGFVLQPGGSFAF